MNEQGERLGSEDLLADAYGRENDLRGTPYVEVDKLCPVTE